MNAPGERMLRVGHGLFDPLRGELALDGRTLRLRPRTSVLLAYLVQHAGRAVGKEELMQAVWPDVVVTEDSLVQCVKEIRQALGAAGHDWIRTLPRKGYAFVADAPPPAQQPAQQSASRSWQWRKLTAFGALLLVLAGSVGWRFWPAPGEAGSAPPRSFVVLPIENLTGDAGQERLAQDITETLTDIFGRGLLRVVAPSTASTYKGQAVDVRSVGARLNVRYIVQGALRLEDRQPVLTLRMADAGSAVQLWQQEVRIAPGWSQHFREDVEGVTTAFINAMRTADAKRAGDPDAVRAAELVARARELMAGPADRNRQAKVQALLEESVRLNDTSSAAWAILAHTYLHDVRFRPDRAPRLQRAIEAAERSLHIAPMAVPALITRGWVSIEEGHAASALKLFDRAIELNPKDAWAHVSRCHALVQLGRPQEALESFRQAVRLSPNDPKLVRWHTFEGIALLHLGQDAAAVQSLSVGAKDPTPLPFTHLYLASALALTGRMEEARAQVARFPPPYTGLAVGRWRALEVSEAPEFRRQQERVYAGLRRAGMPE